MLFIGYPKCSTCKAAENHLTELGEEYTHRNIKEQNPTYEELKEWYTNHSFPLKRFFNTSGILYKELHLKDKLPMMSEEEQLRLLATDGMLVKRPIILTDKEMLIGFKPEEYVALSKRKNG